MPNFIPVIGSILLVVGVWVNRIGKEQTSVLSDPFLTTFQRFRFRKRVRRPESLHILEKKWTILFAQQQPIAVRGALVRAGLLMNIRASLKFQLHVTCKIAQSTK